MWEPGIVFPEIIKSYTGTYANFPLPVLICDRNLVTYWSNDTAKSLHPSLTRENGLAEALAEFSSEELMRRAETEGCCTIADALPLSGVNISITPILHENRTVGGIFILMAADAAPTAQASYISSRTAQALNGSIRASVGGIIEALDSISLKSSLLRTGWAEAGLNRVSAESYRILRVAENILEYVNLQSGSVDMKMELVDLAGFLKAYRNAIIELGRGVGVPVRFRISSKPCIVMADRLRLEMVLFNLIHNSITFARPGNTVDVRAHKDGDTVILTVNDRGIGVPKERMKDVWRPYYTGIPGRSTGLGLTLVRHIAASHGGTAELRARRGGGTSAIFSLPSATLETPLPLGRNDLNVRLDDRFSRLYIGLSGITEATPE